MHPLPSELRDGDANGPADRVRREGAHGSCQRLAMLRVVGQLETCAKCCGLQSYPTEPLMLSAPRGARRSRRGFASATMLGGRDQVVPPSIIAGGGVLPETFTVIPEYDRVCCWVELWPRVLDEAMWAAAGWR